MTCSPTANANGSMVLFADAEHVEVEATWGIYQRMIAAYRDPDRSRARAAMTALIDCLRQGVPAALVELRRLGRTLTQRAGDVLAYFDRPGTSNGPTEAINGRLEHLRGSALGFRNLTNYIARSLLETGGFRPRLHPRLGTITSWPGPVAPEHRSRRPSRRLSDGCRLPHLGPRPPGALSDTDYTSPLARRPYDLRHAAVSLWLNAGVPATQVAEWAGHSVNVLLRVYATCIVGQDASRPASHPGSARVRPTGRRTLLARLRAPKLRHHFGTNSRRTPVLAGHCRTEAKGPGPAFPLVRGPFVHVVAGQGFEPW